MNNRSLDVKEVTNLLKANTTTGESHGVWLSHPRRVRIIAQAVQKNASNVVLDGRKFSITRTSYYGGSVHINPMFGAFVPSGYISLRRLKSALVDEDET